MSTTVTAPGIVFATPRARVAAPARPVSRRLPLFVLAGVLGAGCALRVAGLGDAPLRVDELSHYFAARALEQGGDPVLPSGEPYVRGIDYTRIVALALGPVDPPELALRLPAALFGCAALVLFALVAWRMAGPWAAVYATLLFALFPAALDQSRNGVFHAMQLAFVLVAFHAGWQAVGRDRRAAVAEGSGADGGGPDAGAWRREVGWGLVAIAAFLMAARLEVEALAVALAFVVAVLAAALADVRAWRLGALRWSAPLQLAAVGAVAGSVYVALHSSAVPQVARGVAGVGVATAGAIGLVARNMPVVVAAGLASLFYVVRYRAPLGPYLLVWFGLPFALHSLLPWQNERTVLLALPALLLAVGMAAAALLAFVHARLTAWPAGRRLAAPYPGLAAGVAVAAFGVSLLAPTPAFTRALWPLEPFAVAGWDEALAIVASRPAGRPVPVAHARPLTALHYWGALDFTVSERSRQQWLTREGKRSRLGIDEPGGWVWLPMGAPDPLAGVPVLSSPDAIRAAYRDQGSVLIGLDGRTLGADGIRPELYRVLVDEAEELCRGACGPMLLFHWRLE